MKQIKLYGSSQCHKTQYYKTFFETRNFNYAFLDVKKNTEFALELRNLYQNEGLHFPTILVEGKRLRNPNDKELIKWLNK